MNPNVRCQADFFASSPRSLARRLLGCRLVRNLDGERLAGIVVETEAYLGRQDKAAHTFGGRRTPRNASMWLEGGHAYVYFVYGIHHCLNIVAGRANDPVAVLIRALQPLEGIARMEAHRPAARHQRDLCSGPGKLCAALAIDRALDGADLRASDQLFLEAAGLGSARRDIVRGPRVGVAYAEEWAERPLRYALAGNPHVSRPAPEQ